MEKDTSLVRYMIGAARIKYEVLDEILSRHPDLQGRLGRFNMAVMLVDAHSIFYRLYREKDLAAIYADNKKLLVRDLVVGFVNVIGHYRRYFATRLGLDNDIIISFNRKADKYKQSLYPDYNDKQIKRYKQNNPDYGFINQALDDAWNFICSIIQYFEGIYCVNESGVDDFTQLRDAIVISDSNLYIVFSRNLIPLQLLSATDDGIPNWYQLFNKRDNSICVNKNDFMKKVILADRKLDAHELIRPEDLPYLWAFGGCPDIGMKGTKHARGIVDSVKLANKLLRDHPYRISSYSFPQYCDALEPYIRTPIPSLRFDQRKLEKRFKALNISLAISALSRYHHLGIASNMIDLFDQTSLENLNDTLAAMGDNPNLLELENLNMSNHQEVEEW